MIITTSTRNIILLTRDKLYLESLSKQLSHHFVNVISLRWKIETDHEDIIVKCQLHSKSGYYRAHAKEGTIRKAVDLVFNKITKQRRRKKVIQKKVIRRKTIKLSAVQ